ncbi:hypothetical protein KVT40_000118 [Elsinoe batatas]|uniref:Major facilitator superfamily (MFS) profile domain-containing protein n=1 Tax=Elsinoe batatas TaxID=2601811 RepID=A0A8K0LAB3_9PEZI|nr:hypothetical protein KVT40_000118 [Elsinoe batatas]
MAAVVPKAADIVTAAMPLEDASMSSGLKSPSAIPEYDTAKIRALNRKLDMRVLPPIVVLWFWAFIDRVNMGSARVFGLERDLKMVGDQFNIALVIFFIPFILLEVPSNLVMTKRLLKPSTWLCLQVFCLACFTVGQGVVQSFSALVAMRWFIGVFEAGLVPGCIVLLSTYYPRFDLQWRLNILMVGNALAGAFGGLLAYAIAGLSGRNGYSGWRWIFIIEGCVTAAIVVLCWVLMVDWPEEMKWLNDEEREMIKNRIHAQAGTFRMDRFDGPARKRTFLDWKILINILIYVGTVATTYSINLFSPTIVQALNPTYSGRRVQALCIPIFVLSTATALGSALVSDKLRHRYGVAMVGYITSIAGFAILLNQRHVSVGVRYAALYIISGGSYISLPTLWTMMVNNVSGRYKTSYASAAQIGLGSSGGILASLVFQRKEAPFYWKGYYSVFGVLLMSTILITVYTGGLYFENKKRAKGGRDYRFEDKDIDNMGDDHPDFRFVY